MTGTADNDHFDRQENTYLLLDLSCGAKYYNDRLPVEDMMIGESPSDNFFNEQEVAVHRRN